MTRVALAALMAAALAAGHLSTLPRALAQTAETSAAQIFGPYGDRKFEPAKDPAPSAEALLQTSLYGMQSTRARKQADGTERYQILETRVKGESAVLVYRVLPANGDALAFARTVCPTREKPVDVQALLFFADGVWGEYPGDTGLYRDFGCKQEAAPDKTERDDWLSPPRFSTLTPEEKAGVTEPAPGSPVRAEILDTLRAWNADLSSKIAIAFVVRILRTDGRFAYVVAKVRQKANGKPIPLKIWGLCEQDPEDGSVEALMERVGGRWKVVAGNRCADDVLLSDETRKAHRALVIEP